MSLGAKEGLVHLLWVLLGPGDVALVPSPSYPIHLFAPGFAGAAVARVPVGPGVDFVAGVKEAWERVAAAAARAALLVPAQPDDGERRPRRDAASSSTSRASTRSCSCTTSRTPTSRSTATGRRRSSSAEGAREVAVELYSLTKGFSLAGWRVAFLLGRADVVGALARLKSYLDYGSFQPLQIAATIALRDARERPAEVAEIYGAAATRSATASRASAGTCRGRRRRCSSGRGSRATSRPQDFALRLLREAHVAVSPGSGFGPDGEGYVRFALVENEQRIAQAVRGIRRALG